jgi:hypothetical protein|tara:strand:- start:400 stop:1020 length:621 start_codon:yes stop_codon:yes gene_type:complete
VIRLATHLDIPRHQAIGILCELWSFAINYAEDGDLSQFSDAEISYALEQNGNTVKALVAAGFIEEDGNGGRHLHDWYEYQGVLITRRAENAKKQKRYRERKRNVTGTLPSRDGATRRNETKRDEVLEKENVATVKKATRITDKFVQKMIDRYRSQKPQAVQDAIADARGHSSYTRWSDKQRYVQNWLKRKWPESTTDLSNWGDREL